MFIKTIKKLWPCSWHFFFCIRKTSKRVGREDCKAGPGQRKESNMRFWLCKVSHVMQGCRVYLLSWQLMYDLQLLAHHVHNLFFLPVCFDIVLSFLQFFCLFHSGCNFIGARQKCTVQLSPIPHAALQCSGVHLPLKSQPPYNKRNSSTINEEQSYFFYIQPISFSPTLLFSIFLPQLFLSCHPLSPFCPSASFFVIFILPFWWEWNNQAVKLASHGRHGGALIWTFFYKHAHTYHHRCTHTHTRWTWHRPRISSVEIAFGLEIFSVTAVASHTDKRGADK